MKAVFDLSQANLNYSLFLLHIYKKNIKLLSNLHRCILEIKALTSQKSTFNC